MPAAAGERSENNERAGPSHPNSSRWLVGCLDAALLTRSTLTPRLDARQRQAPGKLPPAHTKSAIWRPRAPRSPVPDRRCRRRVNLGLISTMPRPYDEMLDAGGAPRARCRRYYEWLSEQPPSIWPANAPRRTRSAACGGGMGASGAGTEAARAGPERLPRRRLPRAAHPGALGHLPDRTPPQMKGAIEMNARPTMRRGTCTHSSPSAACCWAVQTAGAEQREPGYFTRPWPCTSRRGCRRRRRTTRWRKRLTCKRTLPHAH